MGCSTSTLAGLSVAKNKSATVASTGVITQREISLIRKSWRKMLDDMPNIGAKILFRMFNLQPEVKQIFPFHDVIDDELKNDSRFRGHANRFMQAISAAVDNINDLDAAMASLLYGIGKDHLNFKGFDVEYFDVFPVAILFVLREELGERFSEEVASAWRHLLDFMISNLKKGYYSAKRNMPPPR